MPMQTMLQRYVREVMHRAVFTPSGAGRVVAHVADIPDLTAEGENERDAESNLFATIAAWLTRHLIDGRPLPEVGGVELTGEYGRHMLEVEHRITLPRADTEDADGASSREARPANLELAHRYAEAVSHSDAVQAVYAQDNPEGLTVFTVYQGEREPIAHDLYQAEGHMYDRFPDVRVSFRLLNADQVDVASLTLVARRVYSRA